MNRATTLRAWFAEIDEPIEAVVFRQYSIFKDPNHPWPNHLASRVLSLIEAEPYLGIEFDSGYGTQGCPYFVLWTKSKVYFLSEYDGSTELAWVERHPPGAQANT